MISKLVSGVLAEILRDAVSLARSGLKRRDPSQVASKATRDHQTSADRNVDLCIAKKLREAVPDWHFDGEEFGAQGASDAEAPILVIDPIDGTRTYAWGIPHFGIVMTLVEKGMIPAGAVFDPMMDEMCTADHGQGAALNGVPLRVSAETSCEHMLFGARLPVPGQVVTLREADYAAALSRAKAVSSGLRRLGLRALSIAWIGARRLDGFFEDRLGIDDFGASALLVPTDGIREWECANSN